MTEIHVIVTGPEEAYDNAAEFWCANELMGVTVLHEGRLHLRIDPRDRRHAVAGGHRQPGAPWPRPASGWRIPPAWRALAEACQRLAAY